jgi:hypothetical protein
MKKLIIVFLFSIKIGFPADVYTEEMEEGSAANNIGVKNSIADERDPDQGLFHREISEKQKDIPYCMRSVYYRDIIGVLAATTTSFIPKFFGGVSAIYLSKIMLDTLSIAQSKISKSFFQNTTIENFREAGLIIDFSHMEPIYRGENITEYVTYPYENKEPSFLSQETALWGLVFGGVYSILSSVADLCMAGYNTHAILSDCTFESMVNKAIEHRKDIGKTITEDNVNDFLYYAVGEYIDMYQKRGTFNEKIFIALLKKY